MITTAKSDGMIIEQVEHEYRPIPDNKVDSNKQTWPLEPTAEMTKLLYTGLSHSFSKMMLT